MKKYAALCLNCRNSFTEEQIAGASACPSCGSKSIPADPNDASTVTLTNHEWRLICIWAHNWGKEHSVEGNPIDGIVGEMRKQNPDMPCLTMDEEFAAVKKEFPTAEMYDGKGNKTGGDLN